MKCQNLFSWQNIISVFSPEVQVVNVKYVCFYFRILKRSLRVLRLFLTATCTKQGHQWTGKNSSYSQKEQ